MRLDEQIKKYTELVNNRLSELVQVDGRVSDAMLYSLKAGGKRIRPILTLEFCRMFGGDYTKAIDTACAIEMIHTFSLIHDDLPCMDDDDMRRGQPSCHKAFGEATALLAGDALSVLPFEIIAVSAEKGDFSANTAIKLIQILSTAVGTSGMIGGQEKDTLFEGQTVEPESLLEMYSMKTSALLRAACLCGCTIAKADNDIISAAYEYAENLGLAFQIIDDILDIKGDSTILGKSTGSDQNKDKPTYAYVCGIEASEQEAQKMTNRALEIAECFPDSEFLCELTKILLIRNK